MSTDRDTLIHRKPLRDALVELVVPRDLTTAEAEALCRWIMTLPMPASRQAGEP